MESANLLAWNPSYLSLGRSEDERRREYARYLRQAIPEGEWSLIREALLRGQLTGTAKFVDEIERIAGLRIEHRGRGRPKKETANNR